MSAASHLGSAGASSPPAARRSTTKATTMSAPTTTTHTSSWVMPEMGLPKPLKMRSKCSRWKNTATPPTASSAAEPMQGRHLGAAPLARERRGALGPEEPGRPRHEAW